MEAEFVGGGEEVRALIAVSFLEDLPTPGETAAEMRQLLGPALKNEVERMWPSQ
jgi:hypothetical protein